MVRCAKLIWSGVGLKENLSAGIASAAAAMFFAERVRPKRRASLTGFAEGAAGGTACAKVRSGVLASVARTASLRIMGRLLRWQGNGTPEGVESRNLKIQV